MEKLRVITALYGPQDVTDIVRLLIQEDQSLDFIACSSLFDDPQQGVVKSFTMVYAYGDREEQLLSVEENGRVKVTAPKQSSPLPAPPTNPPQRTVPSTINPPKPTTPKPSKLPAVKKLTRQISNETNKNRTRRELSDQVLLYTTRDSEYYKEVSYEVECTALYNLLFTIDFTGTVGYDIIPVDPEHLVTPVILTTIVRPFKQQLICTIKRRSTLVTGSIRTAFKCQLMEADPADINSFVLEHDTAAQKIINDTANLEFPCSALDPHNSYIALICCQAKTLFVDLDFMPIQSSLSPRRLENNSTDHDPGLDDHEAIPIVEWKRPREFLSNGEIKVFCNGIGAEDIRQGQLGNCWFLSALAALTEYPELVYNLFPPESLELNPYGVYNLRFCKMGIWQTIRIDDLFPCYPGSGPIFSRSNGNELWVLLLEKVFKENRFLFHSKIALK